MLWLLVAMLSAIPVIRAAQARVPDSFFRVTSSSRVRSQVVLVLIDDQSLLQYGRWPWSREVLAQLTRNLAQAGARVVGLDILLSEPQSPDADNAMRSALRQSRAILVDKIGSYPDGSRWIEPRPEFAESVLAVGHAQTVLDVDSVCRRFPPRELTVDGSRWAFAVEVARHTDPQKTASYLAAYDVPLTDESSIVTTAKPVLIPIAYRRDSFDVISARSAILGDNLAIVRGRPVLVGFDPSVSSDRLMTPLTTELPTCGIEIHAQILDSILNGRKLKEAPLWVSALGLFLVCLAVVSVFRRGRGWPTVVLLFVSAGVIYGVAWLVFLRRLLLLPVGTMMTAVVLGPLLVYTADFVVVERSLTRQLQGLRSWLSVEGRKGHQGTELSWKLDLLQKLQTELGSLYELHKTLLESTQDLVAIFDEHSKLLLQNRAFVMALPCPAAELLTLEDLKARLKAKEDAPITQLGGDREGEAYLGDELYSVRIVPMPPTSLSPGGGTIVTLTSLKTRVERDRARSEALGFITHELRTPLASIQGFAELMMRYPSSPACERAPETIFRESKRLLALISSYLDVLRLDAGARMPSKDVVDLVDVVRQTFDILQPLAAAAKMNLLLETKGSTVMIGDAALLHGAVLNLVSNAIKYGKPGTDIRVTAAGWEQQVTIRVHNFGEIIPAESISRVFDPYHRASNVEKAKTGWGLGLAFVKRIAEKHGGSVVAESSAGGNVFEIRLPAGTGVETPERETV